MTPEELSDLMDLSLDGLLPEALQARLDHYLNQYPEAAEEYQSLGQTVVQLKAHSVEQPDPWFVERLLDGLLRDTATDTLSLKSQRSA